MSIWNAGVKLVCEEGTTPHGINIYGQEQIFGAVIIVQKRIMKFYAECKAVHFVYNWDNDKRASSKVCVPRRNKGLILL